MQKPQLVDGLIPPPPPPVKTPIYIYPLIYTPLPNSTWLHHTHVTALRYVTSVQLGAYMCLDGLNLVKMGSTRTPLSTANGVGLFLKKTHF